MALTSSLTVHVSKSANLYIVDNYQIHPLHCLHTCRLYIDNFILNYLFYTNKVLLPDYYHAVKVDLCKGYWNPPRKMEEDMHFSFKGRKGYFVTDLLSICLFIQKSKHINKDLKTTWKNGNMKTMLSMFLTTKWLQHHCFYHL